MKRQLLFSVLLFCAWTRISAASQPPSIYVQSTTSYVFFKKGEALEMKCVAKAIPNATYTWKRNRIDYFPCSNDGRIVQLPNVGTIIISRPEEARDRGYLQCLATNDFGVSSSLPVHVLEARFAEFPISASITHRPLLGASLTLECVPPNSLPSPEIYWVVKETDGMFNPIVLDARVTMDHEYNLRITNVKPEDQQDGKAYACMAVNPYFWKSTQGPENFIVTQGATEEQRPVTHMWSSPSHPYGLRGEPFKIKCIFAGNPTPDVRWNRTDGKALSDNAYYASYGQELVFPSLQFSDEGDYECSATNILSLDRVQRYISFLVESRPYWIEEPKDLELGVGQTAHFKCLADGVPLPSIFWLSNNVPLGEISDPRIDHRFKRVTPSEIVFENVTLNDAMVLQCNVTGKHGSMWGDMYLNVLARRKTQIEERPLDLEVDAGTNATFICSATTGPEDVQNLKMYWMKDNKYITANDNNMMMNNDNNSLTIISTTVEDSGTYTCIATNSIDNATESAKLTVKDYTSATTSTTPLIKLITTIFVCLILRTAQC